MGEELKYTWCDPNCGGKPLCKLATLEVEHRKVRTVHLKGATAREVLNKKRDPGRNLWDGEFDTMIIGEAPGADEDRTGMPFVGMAGDILSNFIKVSGICLDRTYVTNLVKCRPPKNRKPAAAEIKACRAHIEYEIRKFKPKVIVLLGMSTYKLFNLDKQGGVGRIHGQLYERQLPTWPEGPLFKVIPTYHPAAFLHRPNPKLRQRVLDDYVYVKMVAGATGDAPVKPYYQCDFKVCETLEDVREMCGEIADHGIFSFDTESPDLKFKTSPMIMCQFSLGKGKTWVVPFYQHDPDGVDWKLKPYWDADVAKKVRRELVDLFVDPKIPKIAHNLKYDYKVIWRWLGCMILGRLWDTQCMKHLLNEYPPSNLAFLADMEFGTGDWEVEVKKIVGQGKNLIKSYDNIPDDLFWPYAANDSELTYRLFEIYMAGLNAKPYLLKLYHEESEPAIRTLAKAEWVGNHINQKKLYALDEELDDELEQLTLKCRTEYKEDFNPASPKQVADLFTDLGLSDAIDAPYSAMGYTTNKETLTKIANDHPIAGTILRFRNVKKLKSTYTERIIEDLDPDGRLRYSFMIPGTTSGRLSARLLHQIHNVDEERVKRGQIVLRDLFDEEGGMVYFYGDYSQIELRIFAIVAEELEMMKMFEEGGDAHTITAAAALGVPIEKISKFNRTHLGKRLNFAILYGSEGSDAAKGSFEDPDTPGRFLQLDHKMIRQFIGQYKRKYPRIDEYLDFIPDLARSQGCMIQSLFGRERHIQELAGREGAKRNHAERECVNFTIQSPAAAITLRTMNQINDALEYHDVPLSKVRLLNTVHDSFAYGVHPKLVDWFNEIVHTIAERSIPELDFAKFKIQCGWSEESWTQAEMRAS